MTDNLRDVIVVGAGIVGCLTAFLLAKEGLKVTLLEADSVGSHASGFAFGEMGALEGSGRLHVTGCKKQPDANGLIVLVVYIQVSGPVLEVAPVRQQLLDAGFQRRPAPPRSP